MRRGEWQRNVGTELGRQDPRRGRARPAGPARSPASALAFGMRVVAWSQNLDPVTRRTALGVEPVSKADLLGPGRRRLAAPEAVTSARTGIIGAAELALMRPTAYLVNTSRGPLVDTDALVDALVVPAGSRAQPLDVFDTSSRCRLDDPLRSAPRTSC